MFIYLEKSLKYKLRPFFSKIGTNSLKQAFRFYFTRNRIAKSLKSLVPCEVSRRVDTKTGIASWLKAILYFATLCAALRCAWGRSLIGFPRPTRSLSNRLRHRRGADRLESRSLKITLKAHPFFNVIFSASYLMFFSSPRRAERWRAET